jgi:hypothetical protein
MKYTLTCQQGDFKNTLEFNEDFLPSVLENMQLFLKGCGFYFDGTLDIINEETEELYSDTHDFRHVDEWTQTLRADAAAEGIPSKQPDMFDNTMHSQHYYDTERNKPVGA